MKGHNLTLLSMIENDVISIGSAEPLLSHLVEVKDSGTIGDAVWCKVALAVLQHIYFSDFTPLCHEVVDIGIEKSTHLVNRMGVGRHWTDEGNRYRNHFESIRSHFKV